MTHRGFYTQKLSHTEAFTARSFRTQKLLRANTFTHRDRTHDIAILTQFLAIELHFVRKGCARILTNRNITTVFGDRTSFRAKGLRRTLCKSQFYFSFWRSNLISCERVAPGTYKLQFYFSFWRSNLISCERVAPDALQIAILLQFSAIEPHFVRKGCISWRLVGTAPRLQERNRKEGGSKRAREQESKRECEDVKMRRCEDAQM